MGERRGRAFALAVVCFIAVAHADAQPAESPNSGVQPSASDAEIRRTTLLCNSCHLDKFEASGGNAHVVLGDAEWQARTNEVLVCRNCHGDVTRHVNETGGLGNVFAFREEPVLERNAVCLGCHRDTHPSFDRSPHALAGLGCTNCHSQHNGGAHKLLRSPEALPRDVAALGAQTRVCFDCHGAQFAELELNEHHRLREGVLECTSCHNPHAPVTRSLLGGFKQEGCIECHSDKGGPFVFEHPASRIETCTACHAPHGSPNRHMLAHQRVAELCFSCHAAVPAFHAGNNPATTRFTLDTQCTNCHSAIHGSNFSPVFLR